MSRKIKLALVGCGGMGNHHANTLKTNPDAEIVALCDIRPEAMEKVHRDKLENNPAIKRYNTYDELLKHPPETLDGVLILTPHTLHFEQSMAALEHKLAVLVEKPMVTASDHARQLWEKVQQTKGKLQVAFNSTYSQEFAYIRDVLQHDGIGELQTVTAYSCQGWRNGTRGTWRQDPKLSGGGQMYDSGAHLFNSLAWLMDRPATEVFCWTDHKGVDVDINAAITIKWKNPNGSEILGSVTISGNTPGWQEGIWIAGEKGRLVTGIHGGRLEHYDAKGGLIKYPPVTQNHYTPSGNFVAWLLGQAEPRCPIRYGVLHSWLMDALYQSAAEGKPVKLSEPPL